MRCIYHCWKIVWSPISQSATRKHRNLQPSTPSFWACAQAGASRGNRSTIQPKWFQPCAKRGKRRKGPCVKDAKQPRWYSLLRQSANGRYGVRRSRQKTGNSHWHRFRPAPVFWAKFARMGKFSPHVFFSFGPCTARFLFFSGEKKRKWGVQ